VDVITCAIFGDCRLRAVGVVRGVSLPSPIDLRCRPYNTGPCDKPRDPVSVHLHSLSPCRTAPPMLKSRYSIAERDKKASHAATGY